MYSTPAVIIQKFINRCASMVGRNKYKGYVCLHAYANYAGFPQVGQSESISRD